MDSTHDRGASELSGLKRLPLDLQGTGLIAVDSRRRVCAFNSTAQALTGVSLNPVKRPSIDALPESLQALINETFASPMAASERYLEGLLADGSISLLHARVELIHGSDGQVKMVLLLLSQVVAGQKVECDLEQLNRLASVGTASAALAHELRNAFVAIKTFVQKLLEEKPDAELATVVAHELERVNSLTRQMLAAARPAAASRKPVSVHQALRHALQLIQAGVAGNATKTHCSLQAELDVVQGDLFQLEQALFNVLSNSLAAMPLGGTLAVSTANVRSMPRKAASRLQITIEDTGYGIAPEHLNRVFAPFFTTKAEGTGLGLAITKRIIEEHQGEILITSKVGKGTQVRIVLPILPTRSR